MELMTPTIHLNGTGAKTLRLEYKSARETVHAALEAVQDTAPNARDYYVKNDVNAFRTACQQHQARMERLAQVRDELDALYMACIPAENGSEID